LYTFRQFAYFLKPQSAIGNAPNPGVTRKYQTWLKRLYKDNT